MALRHVLARRNRDRLSLGLSGAAKAACERGIGVNIGRRSPLTDQLAEWTVAVELSRSDGNARELVRERAAVDARQELEPRESVGKSLVQRLAVVDSQSAESSSERHQRDRSLGLPIGSGQPEVWIFAASKQNVSPLEVADYIVGMAEKIGERSFDDTHCSSLSDELQK
jgi:hypothetical protein